MPFQQFLAPVLGFLGVYVVFKIVELIYKQWTSPLNVLPGPKGTSIIYGNMKEIWDAVRRLFPYTP